NAGRNRIYSSARQTPATRVAVVLGTNPVFQGLPNPYFEARMDAAAALYRAHRVEKILVTGDHGRSEYDEPDAMKAALIRRGVKPSDIALDFAG
ncbi:ElyC/SanA/YdcF family protein, partial [Klebsiella pneumoniae]